MEKNKKENIYIFWHFTTHGIAYFKHILSAAYAGKFNLVDKKIKADNICQAELNLTFDTKQPNAFLFDKVYYLSANQNVFDKITSNKTFKKENLYLDDELIKETKTHIIWKDIIEQKLSLPNEIKYFNEKYPDKADLLKSQIWRNIQHYDIIDQIWWFNEISNARIFYSDKIEYINMTEKYNITDLRDYISLANGMQKLLKNIFIKHPNANFLVNPSLGSNQIQVVWFSLAAAGILPKTTRFINTYDDKSKFSDKRFKKFGIFEVPLNIIEQINLNINLYAETPKSEKKQLAQLKMKQYLKSGFAILLLGERGIGKTKLAEDNKEKQEFVSVNCASFTDDSMAESELFGYKKGAFTGADKDKEGLFEKANNGILFLDEIHHLNKRVQARLMKSIQTDEKNNLTIRRLGDNEEKKIQTKLIFASNLKINDLRKTLLPDFYDRISQLVIELPALREAFEDISEEFEKIWKQMKFEQFYPFNENVKNDKKLFEWLKTLKLYGNYRDLQKISIYYKTFLDFKDEITQLIPEKSPFEFAQNQFGHYISYNLDSSNEFEFFSDKKNVKQMLDCFKKKLAIWARAKYKGAPNAAKHFHKLGGNTTKETIYSWEKLCEHS